MELLCFESESGEVENVEHVEHVENVELVENVEHVENLVRAQIDPVILDDPRVVMRLLDTETQYLITESYFGSVQDEVTEDMRRICLSWLLEVADNERCEDAVFPLAANYMDRYLALVRVPKNKLQLLACVCLMLATKLRQSRALRSGLLVAYTDFAYTTLDIVEWEADVLNTLKWRLAAVTAHDYVDTILYRLPEFERVYDAVRSHSRTFQQLIALDFEFSTWPPSLIALATIAAAVRGLSDIENVWPPVRNLSQIFHEMTDIDIVTINNCIEHVEAFVNNCINNAQRREEENADAALAQKRDGDYHDDNPDTPPNVSDVKF